MTSLKRITCRVAAVLACIPLILFCVVVVNTSWKYDRQEKPKLSQTEREVGNGATWKAKSEIKNISVNNTADLHFSLQEKLNDSSTNLLGKVKRGKKHIIIYNNVPKCGSRSLAHSIKDTLKRNGDFRGIEVKGNKMKGSDLSKSFRGIHAPSYISGHMPFVVPSRENIVYINMVRDPIQRFISMYYFAINGDESGVKPGSKLKSNRTIDEYIKDGGAVTSHIYFHFDRYDLYETANSSDSILQRSKANIDKYFILVGLTEELEATVVLLQKLLPDLLQGLHRMYKKTTAATVDESMGSTNLLCFWLLCVILYTALTFVSSGEVPTVYAHLGDEVTIPCELDESQADVQWTRGANVEDSEVNLLVYILGGVEDGDCILSDKCALSRRDLILRNVELSDQDRYYCSASSGKEYTENKLSILIEPEMLYPMINFCGDDQNCTFPFPVGYPLWLRCEVSGSQPAVDLVWYNDTDVIDDTKTEAKETVQGTYDTVSRLKIEYSTHSVFRCEAVGESVPDERLAIAAINFTERDWPDFDDIILPTAAAIVEPLKPYPRITHCDEDVIDCTYIFPNGYNLLLTCEVVGSRPPVHLTWLNGMAELDSKETVYNITEGLFNTYSTLEVEHNDSSVYYCIASGMSLPGKGTASITVAEEDLVPAAQEGLSGGGKAAVAAGGVVSVGVVAGVAREPIMKTGSSVLKKIPGMGGQEKESSSGKKGATKSKKRRKKEDVEAELEEEEEFIDEDETEMKDMDGSQVHVEDETRTQSKGKSKKTKHKTKCQIHQEDEDEEDSVENENMQMKGIQPSDGIDSNEEVEEEDEEEEEEEQKEDEDDQGDEDEDEDEDESKEDEEDIEDEVLLPQDEMTTEKQATKSGKPTAESTKSSKKEGKGESSFFNTGFSSLLEGPKNGFDSLKATIMEKVEGVTSSGKDFIGKYVPTSADELMEDLQETVSEKTQQLQDTVTEKTNELQSELEDKAKGLHTSIEDKAKELQTSVEDKAKGLQSSFEDKAKRLQTSVEDKSKELQTSVEDKAKGLQTSGEDKAKGLQSFVEDKAKGQQASVEDKAKGLHTSVEDKAKGLQTSAENKL